MSEKFNVKVLVGYHEKAVLLKDEILTPINVGRALLSQSNKDKYWLTENTIGDDTGHNISNKNKTYNEMTAIYWAWKNQDKIGYPDAIGFQHYRRHLVFNNDLEPKNGSWTINFPGYIGGLNHYLKSINYSPEELRSMAREFPCIVGTYESAVSVHDQYKHAENTEYHHIEDLDFVCDYIIHAHKKYESAVNAYINGYQHFFGNIFIFHKEIFNEYCAFIFDVLEKFEDFLNKDPQRSEWESRFFVSERITGIFITKLIQDGIKVKKLPVSFVENTKEFCPPSCDSNAVNLAFAVDKNYLPQLAVTLASINETISSHRDYHAYIMHVDIPLALQKEFKESFEKKDNFSIEFIDVSCLYNEIPREQLYIEIHVTVSTYYRFLIQKAFPNFEKILYLDSDIIVLSDIAELYDTDISGKLFGAALDIRENFASKLDLVVSNGISWRSYLSNTLTINPFNQYFQAGVILFNLFEMRNVNFLERCLIKLQELKKPILSDQDVLNSEFKNDVFYIDTKWNIEWQILFEFPDYKKNMPSNLRTKFDNSLSNPSIIHYASSIKPWNDLTKPLSAYWWTQNLVV